MKKVERFLLGMMIASLLCMLVYALSSCAATGYGCNGRSKCMTRVR